MIRVKIADSERAYEDTDSQWVTEQVRGYERANGTLPCVRVSVDHNGANMSLSTTATCPASGALGGHAPNRVEAEVLDWWKRLHLLDADWTQGNLWAFLQRLPRLL